MSLGTTSRRTVPLTRLSGTRTCFLRLDSLVHSPHLRLLRVQRQDPLQHLKLAMEEVNLRTELFKPTDCVTRRPASIDAVPLRMLVLIGPCVSFFLLAFTMFERT